jgi:hypothetical protein
MELPLAEANLSFELTGLHVLRRGAVISIQDELSAWFVEGDEPVGDGPGGLVLEELSYLIRSERWERCFALQEMGDQVRLEPCDAANPRQQWVLGRVPAVVNDGTRVYLKSQLSGQCLEYFYNSSRYSSNSGRSGVRQSPECDTVRRTEFALREYEDDIFELSVEYYFDTGRGPESAQQSTQLYTRLAVFDDFTLESIFTTVPPANDPSGSLPVLSQFRFIPIL